MNQESIFKNHFALKNMISFFNKSMPLYLPNVTGIRSKLKIMMMTYSASEGLQNFHSWPFLCALIVRKRCLVSLPLLTRMQVLWDRVLFLWPDFILNTLLKALSPNIVTLGFKASTYKFEGGGDTIQCITSFTKQSWPMFLPLINKYFLCDFYVQGTMLRISLKQ